MTDIPKTLGHATVAVTVSSQEAVEANPRRTYLLLQNDSTSAIYVSFGATAALGQGVRLNADGGSLEISARNQNLDSRAVNAIHAGPSGTVNLLVTEA